MHNRIHGNEMEGQYEFAAEGMRLSLMSGHLTTFEKSLQKEACTEEMPALHTHFWYELFFVTKGCILLQLEEGALSVSAGELLIVAPDVLHYAEPTGNEDVEQYVFNFSVTEAEKTKASRAISSLLSFPTVLHVVADGACHRDATMLAASLLRRQGALSGCYLLALLLNLATDKSLRRVERHSTEQREPSEEADRSISDSTVSRLYRLEHLFNTAYTLDISLERMAAEMHLSARQLARIIRAQYGCTYHEHVLRLRMKTAKKLLDDGRLSLARIATRVGYSSFGGFTTAFRKYYGTTPSDYRKRMKAAAQGETPPPTRQEP